ncbi:hypothetical protein ACFL59_01175 [Planctomycetota bacterium]
MDDKKGFLRLNHFHGLRLESTDFQVGETYHLEKKKLHNRVFHSYGVVEGYSASGEGGGLRVLGRRRGDMSVEIAPGYALDGEGNDVFLHETEVKQIDPSKYRLPQDVFIVLKYVDEPTEFTVNAANPKYKGHKRVLETSKVEIVGNEPDPEEGIELARIHLTDEITEIKDAGQPTEPKPGEIDLRFRPRAGVCGSTLDPELLQQLREVLVTMRRVYGHLGNKFNLHAARDMRDVVVAAQMIVDLNLLATQKDAITLLERISSLKEEMLEEFQMRYPDLVDTREYGEFKQNIHALVHIVKAPKFTIDEFNNLVGYLLKSMEMAHGIGEMEVPESTETDLVLQGQIQTLSDAIEEMKKAPPPPPAEEEEEEEEEDTPKPKKKKKAKGEEAAAGAKVLSWEELQALSGDLPDKIFMEGRNYNKTDEIKLVDRKDEKAHSFKMADYKDKWSTNQTYKYPDGTKTQSKGQAHVGGYSQWEFAKLQPGRELIIAKRIDYAYSGLVTGIHADGKMVGEWKIEGQDRKFRWRNWLFRIPGEYITGDKVTIKQESIDAEREVNMFWLWCYQAAEA